MKQRHFLWYSAALAAAIVGAIALGAPPVTVLLGLVVLACPVMMMFMMGHMGDDHGAGHDSTDIHDEHHHSAGQS
ncbi:MAG: hypothetical protein J0H22_04955 [Actinobacteria bacterium]|nr:hypothetical protein [Actinomycetota bacterium]